MTVKHKFQRIGVFVDVSNMYYSAKNLYDSFVNFNEVLKAAVSGRQLIRAFAYVIRAYIEQEKSFFEALEKQGFEVRSKDLQIFPGGMKKGDWDVGICIDMIKAAPRLDTLVLVSGDGDFIDLLVYLHARFTQRVEVIGFGRTTSRGLIEEADGFIDLEKRPSRFLIKQKPPRHARRGAPQPQAG